MQRDHRIFRLVSIAIAALGLATAAGCSAGNGRSSGADTGRGQPSQESRAPSAHSQEGTRSSLEILAFQQCEKGVLRVELNSNGETSKEDMLKVFSNLAQYPKLRSTSVPSGGSSIALQIKPSLGCHDSSCAEAQGWTRFQQSLKNLPGVVVTCEAASVLSADEEQACEVGGEDDLRQDEPKQDEPKQDESEEGNARQEAPGVGVGS